MYLLFSDNLQQVLKARQLTIHRLATLAHIDPGLMHKVSTGKRRASDKLLAKLAACEALGLSEETLKLWRLSDERAHKDNQLQATQQALAAKLKASKAEATPLHLQAMPPLEGFYRFPCKGTVSAGPLEPQAPVSDIEYYEFSDVSLYGSDLFCLKISGNSMAPEFQDGGILLLRPVSHLVNNGLYVVEDAQGRRTFKLLRCSTQTGQLLPLNPEFEPLPIEGFELKQLFQVLEYKKLYAPDFSHQL